MDDLFLKILNGDIPSSKIYEDNNTFAILDINPNNKGHTLIIPKKRYRNIYDIPEDILLDMMKTVKKIVPAIRKVTKADGFNIGMNNEKAAGQEVMHAHIHIIPRFDGDGVYKPAHHTKYKEGEKDILAERIREELL